MLLAGNLVGMGVITAYLWGIDESGGIWLAAGIVWAYTVSGGLFSVAYTDVVQGLMGWSGVIVCAYWYVHASFLVFEIVVSVLTLCVSPRFIHVQVHCQRARVSCSVHWLSCCFQ